MTVVSGLSKRTKERAKMLKNHADFSKFTDEELEATLEQVDVELKEFQNTRKQIVETILQRNSTLLENLLRKKTEPYGTVHLGGLVIDFPKKVTYDQPSLKELAQQIMSAGEDPAEYIDIKYDVKEAKFKSWPSAIKNQFIAARTVKRGNASVKFATDKE